MDFIADIFNNFIAWAAVVNLTDFIKVQYVAMCFFILGAFTSPHNRHSRVFQSNLYTLVIVLLAFFIQIMFSYSAINYKDESGLTLAGIIRNDVIRVTFNFCLITGLLYRMIRTCCYSRLRELRFNFIKGLRIRP